MLWVVRAGQKSKFITSIIENSEIYLPWEGYSFPLNTGKTADEYRKIVMKEKGTENRTSVSNWSGQINSFVNEIKIGDYVLIPMFKSREYVLATVSGEYTFNNRNPNLNSIRKYNKRPELLQIQTTPFHPFQSTKRQNFSQNRQKYDRNIANNPPKRIIAKQIATSNQNGNPRHISFS